MLNIKDLDFLDTDTAMINMGNSMDMYIAVLKEYIRMRDIYEADLRQALTTKDYDTYIVKAHALKGNSATVGAMSMFEHAKAHEFAGKEARFDYIEADIDNLINEYDEIVKKIATVIEKNETETARKSGGVKSDEEVLDMITDIVDNLEEFEVDDAEKMVNELLSCKINAKYENALKEAKALMDEFEYEDATEILKNVININL